MLNENIKAVKKIQRTSQQELTVKLNVGGKPFRNGSKGFPIMKDTTIKIYAYELPIIKFWEYDGTEIEDTED